GGQGRVKRVAVAVATGVSAVVVVGGALAMVDSRYYGHLVAAGWNQVKYNVVSGHSDLYGTEPWYFYIKNGLINGNIIMVLALLSLPAWITYYVVLRLTTSTGTAGPTVDRLFASHRLLLYRILPFFVSLGIFSLQPHKEERFLAIAYPHMCFNAAVCLSLLHPLRAWMQAKTKQRWAAQSDLFNMGILAVAAAIGLLRMGALHQYYGGVASVFLLLPKLTASGSAAGNMLLPIGMTIKTLWGDRKVLKEEAMGGDAQKVVCMGKDWYRFPSSYWLPAGYRLEFIESQFTGHLPGSFVPVSQTDGQSVVDSTRARRADFNDLNRWEPSHVVSESQCDYMVDTEFPSAAGGEEVPFARREKEWRKRGCERILDAQGSGALGRVLYLPPQVNGRWQRWGEICVFERLE
ncbi:mannosyltransferase, partial [Linderina macrospora]